MENGTQNLAQADNGHVSKEHPATLAKRNAKDCFESLLTMLGVNGHVEAVQLFVGRVPYHTIVDWRRGRAAIPKWAWGYLAMLCRERANAYLQGATLGENPPYMAPGPAGTIRFYNQRRAKEKAQKKNPPIEAG